MNKRPRWTSLAGQGFELLAAVVGFGLVGYWVGGYFDDAATGLLIGSLLGITGGLYNLIRASIKEVNRQSSSRGNRSEKTGGASRERSKQEHSGISRKD